MAAAMREVEVAAGEIAARHGGKVLAIADARRRLAIAPWRGERWSCDRVSGVSFERRDGAARVVVWQQRGGRRSLSAPSRCEAPSDVTARSVSRWSERKRLRWHQRQIMASEAVQEWRSVPGVTERRRRASARENVPSRTHTGANATARQRAVRPASGSEHGCTVHARARARAKRHAVGGPGHISFFFFSDGAHLGRIGVSFAAHGDRRRVGRRTDVWSALGRFHSSPSQRHRRHPLPPLPPPPSLALGSHCSAQRGDALRRVKQRRRQTAVTTTVPYDRCEGDGGGRPVAADLEMVATVAASEGRLQPHSGEKERR